MPPVAARAAVYAVPIWPLTSEAVVMISAGAIVTVKFLDTDPLVVESVNCSVNPYVAAAVGVPVSNPVTASSARPGGSDPAMTAQAVKEAPEATNCTWYVEPTAPVGKGDEVVIARPAVMTTVMAPTPVAP